MEQRIRCLSDLCSKQLIDLTKKKSLINNIIETIIWENLFIAYHFCPMSCSHPGTFLAPRSTPSSFLQGGCWEVCSKLSQSGEHLQVGAVSWQVSVYSFLGLLGLIWHVYPILQAAYIYPVFRGGLQDSPAPPWPLGTHWAAAASMCACSKTHFYSIRSLVSSL